MTDPLLSDLAESGFAWLRRAVPEPVLEELRAACARGLASPLFRRRQTGVYDIRQAVPELPAIGRAARGLARLEAVAPLLDGPVRLVKAGFYDKGPGESWSLPWHQDTSIGVRRRIDGIEVGGFGPWQERDSLVYVGAPAAVLERILVVRLHLDPADAASGAMEVIPGSHRGGRRQAAELTALAALAAITEQGGAGQGGASVLTAAAGDVLLSRPLLVHRSPPIAPGSVAEHRRVLHFEYSAAELPGGLEWWEPGDLC